MPEPREIAIFLPNWVGDAVMATPALRALRRRFTEAEIVFVGRAGPRRVLAGGGFCDAELDAPPTFAGMLDTARRLRTGGRKDLAVLLPNSFRSALTACLARCRRRVGYARDARALLLTEPISPPRNPDGSPTVPPAVEYYAALATAVDAPVSDRRMELATTSDWDAQADALLARAGRNPDRPLVVLNPGGAFGPSKLWPAERYARVADALIDACGAEVLVNAAPTEREIAAAVCGAMRRRPLVNFALQDNTLDLLKSLLARADLLITNDTGARHIAAALATPCVTIFGSTDPDRTTIYAPRERILRADVPCAPCQQKTCPNPPGPEFHQCMRAIEPERVLAAARDLLDVPRREAAR